MKDLYDVKAYRKVIDRLRVDIFFTGLDIVFEHIRGEILRKHPILELEKCYALIHREATRHATLMNEFDNLDADVMIADNHSKQTMLAKVHLSVLSATKLITPKQVVSKSSDIQIGGITIVNIRRTSIQYP